MSFEEENRSAICAYFAQGAKGNQPCEKLGVEVEHFVVDAATLKAIPYEGEKVAIGRVSEGTSVGVSEGATKGTSAGISEHASEGALEPRLRQHLAFETFSCICLSFILEKCEVLKAI